MRKLYGVDRIFLDLEKFVSVEKDFLQEKDSHTNHYSSNGRQQFEQVYHTHIDALYHYGTKFKANRELVEDCIQDLFADLWERKYELNKIQSLRSYLLGALRRKLLRKVYTNREQAYDAEELNGFFEMHLLQESQSQQSLSEKHAQQITHAFGKLTEKQKEVIYLRFYNQLSFKEIAEVMEVQTRTVYKLAHRSITLLKEELSPCTPALHILLLYAIF
ncbi:RNA polymerase sigma factor [Catalinimonas niigatensis]|uniref:RNA polymerase sigma factor n=1 Tax=Catalinimonas niigatensis TaxID=1397264 RepID=UPI002665ADBE|nr:sigma-70 family RNA polymerase sigma factor [Catalinimonas niigatensis]WPP51739.1 sigma-70 family RNA polymerase sigma factor [Catalinimonas niigatensis]